MKLSLRWMTSPPPPVIDRISALPDELLIHILSFLPTKVAFTTTVLSKRWSPLCHSLTAIRFDDEGEGDGDSLLRFLHTVDAVLLSPQHGPIETLSLVARSKHCDYNPHFNAWVEAAIRRRVKNLELSSRNRVPLPPSIFISQTLVVLNLTGCTVSNLESVDLDFPSLTTLHLKDTHFEIREDVIKFLSGYPNLVDLYANLYVAKYVPPSRRYKPKPLPKLEKARIGAMVVPFTVIYNVKFLRIIGMEFWNEEKYINSYYSIIPVFQNLINLELCFCWFPGWDEVVEVLAYCPKLQALAIEKRFSSVRDYQEQWAPPVPECVSLHLRTCFIQNFQKAHNDDSIFVEYILRNARFLQAMRIHSCLSGEKHEFFKYLSGCPRISPTCRVFLDTKEVGVFWLCWHWWILYFLGL